MSELPGTRRSTARILLRGLRRRCPRCGGSPLFTRWINLAAGCPACRLRFEHRPGDTWAFWIVVDRLVLGMLLLVLVIGYLTTSAASAVVIAGVLVVVFFVVTMPQRMGLCVALDYLSRYYLGDPGEDEAARPRAQRSS